MAENSDSNSNSNSNSSNLHPLLPSTAGSQSPPSNSPSTSPSTCPLAENSNAEKKQPLQSVRASIENGSEATIVIGEVTTETVTATEEEGEGKGEKGDGFLHGFPLYCIAAGLSIIVLLVALDTAIMATAIPTITSELHSLPDVGWYGSVYLLSACTLSPLSGKIYSQFNQKHTFLTFLLIFELGSLICATARSSSQLIIGRAIAGIGTSGLFSGSMVIMAVTIELKQRAAFFGIITSIYGLATIIGPLLGGVLTDNLSWRWCFYINLPCGAVTAILLILLFHPPQTPIVNTLLQKLAGLDLVGCAIFVPAVIMLLLALQWAGTEHAWNSATVLGLLLASLPLLSLFAWWEQRRKMAAMIPLPILFQRTIIVACIATLFLMGSTMVITYYLPLWFQVSKLASPTTSGIMNLPLIVAQMIAAALCGYLLPRLGRGHFAPYLIGGTAITTIGCGLLSTLDVTSSRAAWICFEIVTGLGRGAMWQMPALIVQTVLPSEQVPTGTALIMFFQFFGGALFICLGQTAFVNRLGPALADLAPEARVEMVVGVGATDAARMGLGVRNAYSRALTETFWVAVGAAGVATVVGCGMELGRSVLDGQKKKKKNDAEGEMETETKTEKGEGGGEGEGEVEMK